ncbi:MAG: SDR family oxidoreductase [Verrucomicrobia bacterium]|nr:SDR family oxidoreductase [Verrucomicrobiota bacterium]
MAERFVITGATGFLGREVLKRLVARLPQARFTLLVRGREGEPAGDRVSELVDGLFEPAERDRVRTRIEVHAADLTLDRFGLSKAAYGSLIDGTTHVIHSAATVRFDRPLEVAWQINVGGTKGVLDLARALQGSGSLKALAYIGTAFVAGTRAGLVTEEELDIGQGFRNTYERTKCEAEKLVRAARDDVPVVIARPSIIVGDSRTGITTSFKTLYWPLKVYAKHRWRTVPGHPDAVIDVVPVDFVADAVAHLALDDKVAGTCVHLCAGPEGSATIGEIGEFASAFFGIKPPRFFDPTFFLAVLRPLLYATVWGKRRRVLHNGKVYLPYFRMKTMYDTTRARALLDPAGIRAPKVTEYLEKLFRYCVESDWGRRPVTLRTEAA